jgi:hypothetical protein
MRQRYCKVCDGWHDLDAAWPHNCRPEAPQRSDLPMPMLMLDTMEGGVESQVDGKIYTSKSALRRSYKAAGVIEVGNDPARNRKFKRPPIDRRAIKTSLEKAEARVNRGDVSDHLKHKL